MRLEEVEKRIAQKRKEPTPDFEYEVSIVGINYSNFPFPLEFIFELYRCDYPIILENEPNNPYDKNAISCLIGGERFGYIKRRDIYGRDIHPRIIKSYIKKYEGYKVQRLSDLEDYEEPNEIEILDIKINFYNKKNWSKIKIPKPKMNVQKIFELNYPNKDKKIEVSDKNIIEESKYKKEPFRPKSEKLNSISSYTDNVSPQPIYSKSDGNDLPTFKVSENNFKPSKTSNNEGMGFFYWFLFWDFIFVGMIGLYSYQELPIGAFLIWIVTCFGIPFLMYVYAKSRK